MYGVPCVEMSSERRMAGSSPVTSVKVLWYDRHLFVAYLCGQDVSPGRHSKGSICNFLSGF